MTSKDICKKCLNYASVHVHGPEWAWDTGDESSWDEGWVSCPMAFLGNPRTTSVDITELPPEYCPHAIEHVFAKEEEAA